MSISDLIRNMLFGGGNRNTAETSEPSGDSEAESLLHVGWQQRDEGIYPELFGPAQGEPSLLSEDIFYKDFGHRKIHPFWLHHGILAFPPTADRPTWVYATSGMSNAFDSEIEDWSGLGVEFLMETYTQADWAADKLARLMAFNLLIAIGHYENSEDIKPGSIVRLEVPVNGEENCQLRNLIVFGTEPNPTTGLAPQATVADCTPPTQISTQSAHPDAHSSARTPTSAPATYKLVTGKFEMLQIVAVSDSEADFAEKEGYGALATKLRDAGHFPAVDPERATVL